MRGIPGRMSNAVAMRIHRISLLGWIGLLLVAGAGCGGLVVFDLASEIDGGAPDGGFPADAAVEAGSDAGADAPTLPTCDHLDDCYGFATCQQGVCCAGIYNGGTCTCGNGPGCDQLRACCPENGIPENPYHCVDMTQLWWCGMFPP